jgi:hypothetical protein
MDQLLLTVILLVIFGAHFYITYRQQTWSIAFKVAYTVTLVVPPMSHLWHILYGEDRITCEKVNRDAAFGWTPCFEFNWNNIVNTYEITLTIENIFFAALTYYVLFGLFYNRWLRNILVFALNTALLVLALILLFASPAFLDDYKDTYNWSGFIISLVLWILVDVYVRLPFFYDPKEDDKKEEDKNVEEEGKPLMKTSNNNLKL